MKHSSQNNACHPLYERVRKANISSLKGQETCLVQRVARRMILAGMAFEDMKIMLMQEVVVMAFLKNHGNQVAAAKELEMHRNTFSRHLYAWLRDHKVKGNKRRWAHGRSSLKQILRQESARPATDDLLIAAYSQPAEHQLRRQQLW